MTIYETVKKLNQEMAHVRWLVRQSARSSTVCTDPAIEIALKNSEPGILAAHAQIKSAMRALEDIQPANAHIHGEK